MEGKDEEEPNAWTLLPAGFSEAYSQGRVCRRRRPPGLLAWEGNLTNRFPGQQTPRKGGNGSAAIADSLSHAPSLARVV